MDAGNIHKVADILQALINAVCYPLKTIMRFGLNSFLYCSAFTDSEFSVLDAFKRCGASVAELAIADPSAVTPSKVKAKLSDLELSEPIICGAFSKGRNLRGSSDEVAAATRYIDQLISVAIELDAKVVCGPMYSETGLADLYSDSDREQQLTQIALALKPLCERAQSAGIVLALEPLNRFETDCINTVDQAIGLIERVDSPALKIHIDTFHMNIEEANSAEAIRCAAPHIAHVHASASHRGLLGKDQVDWTGILTALHECEYEGAIVIESFSKGNPILARATSIWRDLYESPEQMSVEGLDFLRAEWARLATQFQVV